MSQPRVEVIIPRNGIEECIVFLINPNTVRVNLDNSVHEQFFPADWDSPFPIGIRGPARVTLTMNVCEQLPRKQIKCYSAQEARERAKRAAEEAVARERAKWAKKIMTKAPTIFAKAIAAHIVQEVLG